MSHDEAPGRRPVRSFVRREGRITAAQRRALEQLWPRFGIDFEPEPLDLDRVFGRRAPRCLEIGFGNGEHLLWLAARHPERDFLGVEVHRPGVGRLLQALDAQGSSNVRVISHDAMDVLEQQIAPGAISQLLLLFPDPWPKKRHHKRRILQPAFVELAARTLAPGGVFHVATDWADYAAHIEEVMAASPQFERLDADAQTPQRPSTRFERRGHRLGHEVSDLRYRRV